MQFLQEYDWGVIIVDHLIEKELKDSRVQAMLKRSSHKNLSFLIISQDYYELQKRTIRANGNIFYIFKPNRFRDVQNLNQDKASRDMNLNEFRFLTGTCWNEKYKHLTIDMTKDKYSGWYRLGLKSKFVPDSTPF